MKPLDVSIPELVLIKRGKFSLGNPFGRPDKGEFPERAMEYKINPRKNVRIKRDFYISIFPITWAQYLVFCQSTGMDPPEILFESRLDGLCGRAPSVKEWAKADSSMRRIVDTCPEYVPIGYLPDREETLAERLMNVTERDNHFKQGLGPQYRWVYSDIKLGHDIPVTNINFYEAKVFTEWLSEKSDQNFRLPTEAEWEFACKMGEREGPYSWKTKGNYRDSGAVLYEKAGLRPVGTYEPDELGLHDMLGNIWEWVEDDYCFGYRGTPRNGAPCSLGKNSSLKLDTNPDDPDSSDEKVVKGGSFSDFDFVAQPWGRKGRCPHLYQDNIGFRVVCEKPRRLFRWNLN